MKNARKLVLSKTSLRVLRPADLGAVAGGESGWTTTDAPSKICPPPSMFTGCPACIGQLPNPTVVINPAKKF